MAVVHHDGFLPCDSKVNRWNAKNMGPKHDAVTLDVELPRDINKDRPSDALKIELAGKRSSF